MNRGVFLDRDGVLNCARVIEGKPYPPRHLAELQLETDVLAALTILKQHGFFLIVVTNQPDLARGQATQTGVDEINARLAELLPLDAILVCPHDDADGCDCRKPRPGLLLQGAARFAVALPQSFMVGDRWRDMEAGQAAGCRTVWIDRGYDEPKPQKFDFKATGLKQAVSWMISVAG